MSIDSDERYTPPHVLDVVREFARIGLDPCCGELAPRTDATHYLSECGLEHSWWTRTNHDEIVYCNPSYSRGSLKRWCAKIVCEAVAGAEIIALLPADLSTRSGTLIFQHANALAFWRKRIAFGSPNGALTTGAKQPSMFAYFGERQGRFQRVFSRHANVAVLR